MIYHWLILYLTTSTVWNLRIVWTSRIHSEYTHAHTQYAWYTLLYKHCQCEILLSWSDDVTFVYCYKMNSSLWKRYTEYYTMKRYTENYIMIRARVTHWQAAGRACTDIPGSGNWRRTHSPPISRPMYRAARTGRRWSTGCHHATLWEDRRQGHNLPASLRNLHDGHILLIYISYIFCHSHNDLYISHFMIGGQHGLRVSRFVCIYF